MGSTEISSCIVSFGCAKLAATRRPFATSHLVGDGTEGRALHCGGVHPLALDLGRRGHARHVARILSTGGLEPCSLDFIMGHCLQGPLLGCLLVWDVLLLMGHTEKVDSDVNISSLYSTEACVSACVRQCLLHSTLPSPQNPVQPSWSLPAPEPCTSLVHKAQGILQQ